MKKEVVLNIKLENMGGVPGPQQTFCNWEFTSSTRLDLTAPPNRNRIPGQASINLTGSGELVLNPLNTVSYGRRLFSIFIDRKFITKFVTFMAQLYLAST